MDASYIQTKDKKNLTGRLAYIFNVYRLRHLLNHSRDVALSLVIVLWLLAT